jgi:hypothetical protein
MDTVSRSTGIPVASYANLENNQRTGFYEQLYRLSRFLNKAWQDRYGTFSDFPKYQGDYLTDISILWIMFGEDYLKDLYTKKVAEIEQRFREREFELLQQLEELK